MFDIQHKFEEIALCVGENKGRRHHIALLSGTALITVEGKGKWDYEEVELFSPIAEEPTTTISFGHPLWDMLCESLDRSCGDEIYTETLEICRRDPDRKHDEGVS